MRTKYFLLPLVVIVLFNSCEDAPDGVVVPQFEGESSRYAVYGTVVDASGNPVQDADIHYFFYGRNNSRMAKQHEVSQPMSSTMISFYVPTQEWVTLRVLRYGTREIISTLKDTICLAGTYAVYFDMSKLTNGLYIYQLIIGKIAEQRILFLQNLDLGWLIKTTPLAKTDSEGKFILPFSILGIGEKMIQTSSIDGSQLVSTVIDSIAVIVYKKDQGTLIDGFKVNFNKDVTRTFILK